MIKAHWQQLAVTMPWPIWAKYTCMDLSHGCFGGIVHIMSLAGFANKGIIFFTWAINYVTKNTDNRLVVRYFNTKTRMTEADSNKID